MPDHVDETFYGRADEHIRLSNDQLAEEPSRGKVSASMMYAVSRFNSWVSATGFSSSEDIRAAKTDTIEYFVLQYKLMLEENLDDYITNFSKYMATKSDA